MPVEIHNRHVRLRVDKRALARHLRGILRAFGRPRALVDVSLVDDEEIRALNRDHRGIDSVTDVLSFALEEAGPQVGPLAVLGDIVISLDCARRQAALVTAAHGSEGDSPYRLREETLFLATHGLLHLLGHDHVDAEEALAMEALERRFMISVTPVAMHEIDRSAHGSG